MVAATAVGIILPVEASAEESSRHSAKSALSTAKSWTYQLQNLDLDAVRRDAGDVLIIDYSIDGTAEKALAPEHVAPLKLKPDGTRRLVVSYMSIGEAESYRYYWNANWIFNPLSAPEFDPGAPSPGRAPTIGNGATGTSGKVASEAAYIPTAMQALLPNPRTAPGWLHHENIQWRGNFNVRFWQPEWQTMIFGTPGSYLDRIIDAGFDGVYLDRADIYSYWEKDRKSSEQEMAAFVARLSAYAKKRKPGFLVILQNAEELIQHRNVRSAIDAVAKEDLLHGIDHTEAANKPMAVAESVRHLKMARKNGLPVFVVEYLTTPARIAVARKRLAMLGFVPAFAPRELDKPTL